ncbi:hypothetical protein J6W34_04970 [bacterium]|nr:hypothetical protein [bacterium]
MSKYYEQAKQCLFFIKNGGGVVELDINVLEVLLWLKWEDCWLDCLEIGYLFGLRVFVLGMDFLFGLRILLLEWGVNAPYFL